MLELVPCIVTGQCRGNINHADLVVAVPGSLLVPEMEFQAFEKQLIRLFRYFAIEPDEFNIGLILYGREAVNIATPQPFKTRIQVPSTLGV